MQIKKTWAYSYIGNAASISVLEKIGLKKLSCQEKKLILPSVDENEACVCDLYVKQNRD